MSRLVARLTGRTRRLREHREQAETALWIRKIRATEPGTDAKPRDEAEAVAPVTGTSGAAA